MTIQRLQDTLAYKGNLPWLLPRTLFLTLAGSHAYGMARPESDTDYRGVVLPPFDYEVGLLQNFEQATSGWGKDANGEPIDCVIQGFRKFLKLALDCNPNIIELLFSDPDVHVVRHPWFKEVIDIRRSFLSRNARHRFSGYAMSQLKRIMTHRRWLLHPPPEPTRTKFDLPKRSLIPGDQREAAEKIIQHQLDSWEFDWEGLDEATKIAIRGELERTLLEMKLGAEQRFDAAARLAGFSEDFLEVLKKERAYRNAIKDFANYRKWERERNRARHELEAKYGFDTKHGSHLVRLLRMGLEILETGEVLVKRPDAAELLAIRNGAWSYERLIEWASAQMEKVKEASDTSDLPKQPDRKLINELCIDIIVRGKDTEALWNR